MKENVDDNLYYVQKLLRIEKVDDQLLVVVKWQNWSANQITKEPIASIKLNPQLAQDLQRLLIQYHSRPIKHKLEQQTNAYAEEYLNLIFRDKSQKLNQTEQIKTVFENVGEMRVIEQNQVKILGQSVKKENLKQKSQLYPQQLATCNFKAQNLVAQRIKYGLANLRPFNYFQLKQKLGIISEKLRKMNHKNLPKTDHAVEEVKGISYKDGSYQFYVCVRSRVIIVPMNEMMLMFPRNLYNFLIKFLRYMQQKMKDEISKETMIINSRRYKARTINTVSKFLNIRQHFQNKKKQIFFGKNVQDVQQNIRLNRQRFLGKLSQEETQIQNSHLSKKEYLKMRNQSDKGNVKKDIQANEISKKLKNLFTQIENQINYTLRECQSQEQMQSQSHRSKSVRSLREQVREQQSNLRRITRQLQENEQQFFSFEQSRDSNPLSSRRSRSSKINQSFPPQVIPTRKSQRIISRSNTNNSHSFDQKSRQSVSKDQYKIKNKKAKNLKRKTQATKRQRSGGKKRFKKN